MNIVYGFLFLFAVSLLSALLLYFFIFRPKQQPQAKPVAKAPPLLKSKVQAAKETTVKTRPGPPPAKKARKPAYSKTALVPRARRFSPETQFVVNFTRELVKQDVDMVVQVIRKWMRER
ncbi:MAG: hypothetical protein HZA01_12215 [Nitrospinae bacterium]|nr:hypothetical protein [Nitrospinota bacterium]